MTPKEMGSLVSMKKDGFKSIPKSILLVCLIIVLLVIVGVVAWKPLGVLNLQAHAGGKIEGYIQTYASEYKNYFACQIPAFIDLPDDEGLTEAVSLLEKAQVLQPENAQTHLLLGKAYCIRGDYEAAIDAFEAFSQGRPGNPLGDLERAFAHFTMTLANKKLSDDEESYHQSQSKKILESQGYSSEYFIEEGNAAYLGAAPAAWYWYHIAELFQSLPQVTTFRAAILDLVFKEETTFLEFVDQEQIIILEKKNNIPPSSFFRLSDGSPVDTGEIKGQLAGMYYRNTDPGVSIIEVLDSGSYCISIQALDSPPEPTLIELTLDFDPLTIIELQNGDETWGSFETEAYLQEGFHLLGIRLTNDGNVNGVDRNGVVGEIAIESCHN